MHLQITVPKENEITRFKSWSGYNVDWYALCHVSCSHIGDSVDCATLEILKTKHTFIVVHVEFLCASFLTTYLESVLKILIPKTIKIYFPVTLSYQVYLLHLFESVTHQLKLRISRTYLTHHSKKVFTLVFWNNSCGP